jgi:hypothetical protein
VDLKINRLKELKLCFKCFKPNHSAGNCKFSPSGNCVKCKRAKHWSFLCNFENTERRPNEYIAPAESNSLNTRGSFRTRRQPSETSQTTTHVSTSLNAISGQLDIADSLLPLWTVTPDIPNCVTRLDTVLDCGSQNSFITTELADKLKLDVLKPQISVTIKGINSTQKIITKTVKLPLKLGNDSYKIMCICVPKINIKFRVPQCKQLFTACSSKNIALAYDGFKNAANIDEISDIDMLLGARDWSVVAGLESGVVGTGDNKSMYYRFADGYILVAGLVAGRAVDCVCNR